MSSTRPAHWATPPAQPIIGLENFHTVSPVLYRGAQPTAEGMQALAVMGVKTVVSLRRHHDDHDVLPGNPLSLLNFGFDTWHPSDDDVVNFLKVVTNTAMTPVYVHCQFGSDRTGTMVAIYRIAVQGWSRDEAIQEMTRGGFGYHPLWINLLHFIHTLDIEGLKARAGLTT